MMSFLFKKSVLFNLTFFIISCNQFVSQGFYKMSEQDQIMFNQFFINRIDPYCLFKYEKDAFLPILIKFDTKTNVYHSFFASNFQVDILSRSLFNKYRNEGFIVIFATEHKEYNLISMEKLYQFLNKDFYIKNKIDSSFYIYILGYDEDEMENTTSNAFNKVIVFQKKYGNAYIEKAFFFNSNGDFIDTDKYKTIYLLDEIRSVKSELY